MNVVAIFRFYNFTHYSGTKTNTTNKDLSAAEKLNILVFGVGNPRPFNKTFPAQPFETIQLQSNKLISCWSIPTDSARGTVVLFHGYGGEKSSMLDKSDVFLKMGYNTLLVDFMGSGDSEGNQTTIGFKEAQEVKTCFDYLKEKGETTIYLFGTSMGAIAILKAIDDYKLNPAGIMIECPFGSMYAAVCARFKLLGVPSFPMAGLLTFWGGAQNGFWAFSHQPVENAKSVSCPALLLYGEKDDKVSREETDEIYHNLAGKKQLVLFPLAKHENYLKNYKPEWTQAIENFMTTTR